MELRELFKLETIGLKLQYFDANLANCHGEISILDLKSINKKIHLPYGLGIQNIEFGDPVIQSFDFGFFLKNSLHNF